MLSRSSTCTSSLGIVFIRDLCIRLPSTSISTVLDPNPKCLRPSGKIMSWIIWSFVLLDGFLFSYNDKDVTWKLSCVKITDKNNTRLTLDSHLGFSLAQIGRWTVMIFIYYIEAWKQILTIVHTILLTKFYIKYDPKVLFYGSFLKNFWRSVVKY